MNWSCPCLPLKNYIVQILAVFVATLAMIVDGMQFGWVSPAVPRLLANDSSVSITKSEGGWLTQYFLFGNLCGTFFTLTIFSKISRKLALFIACLPITIAWIGILVAKSVAVLFISRWIGGVGRNMIYVTVPMYIGEIADPKIRGMLGTSMYLMMNVGVLLSFALTPYFPMYVTPSVAIALALITMVLIYFLPESPYYCFTKGNLDEAKTSLKLLRNTENISSEFDRIRSAVESKNEQNENLIKSFKKLFGVRSNLKALLILIMLRASQVLSGVSAMTMHIHSIFQQVGGNLSAESSAFIYVFMMLTSTFVSMGIMDMFGRRTLTIFSCFTACVAHVVEGSYFFVKLTTNYDTSTINWLPILTTLIFVYGYRVGLGTVPIIMVGELFPTNVKVPGIVLTDLMYSVSNLAANGMFHYTEDKIGMFAPFWIFGIFCFIAAILALCFVPETKGKNLEEIQVILKGKSRQLKEDIQLSSEHGSWKTIDIRP